MVCAVEGQAAAGAASAVSEEEGDLALGMFDDVSGDESSSAAAAWPDMPAQKPKAAPLVGPWGTAATKGKPPAASTAKKKGD